MAKKKLKKPKKIARRAAKKADSRISRKRHGRLAFLVGAITVIILSLLIFRHIQDNNYKTILGEKTKIDRQDSKIK